MLDLTKINEWFKASGEKIVHLRWLNITLFILILSASFYGLRYLEEDTSWDSWFLEDDPMIIAKDRFEEIFGNHDYGAVLVEAHDVFAPEVLDGIKELGRELVNEVPFADEVISLTDCEFTVGTESGIEIINLVPDEIPTSKEDIERIRELAFSKPHLVNKIVSDDSKQTWVMLRLKPLPEDWKNEYAEAPQTAAGRMINEVTSRGKYKILNLRTSGLPIINVEKRDFFMKETNRLMVLSLGLTILVLLLSLRSFRGVVFPILVAAGSMIIVLGVQGYAGMAIEPSIIPIPLFLGLAIAVGYSIHIFNFFKRRFFQTGRRRESIIFAVEETGWPILFTALTTITALLSFLFVPVRSLRWIGLTSAAIVSVTYILVIIMIPSLLSFGRDRNPHPFYVKGGGGRLEHLMAGISRWVLTHPKSVITAFVVIVIVCLAGITRFEVSFDVLRTMGTRIPYVAKLDYIGNSSIGSFYSYDVALEFPEPGAAKEPKNLKKFDQLISEVQTYPLTNKTTSVLDVIKDLNQVLHEGDPEYYRIPETREMIAQLFLLYENAGGAEAEKWVDYDYQRLHLMVEVGYYNSREARRELDMIRERSKELFPDARLVLIGSLSQFTIMQDYVSFGQIKSFMIALAIIAVLLMIVFGSVKTGVIGMIPNIAPALVTGGIMGFAGIPLDMMTVTIMPMLLGLAVDDTIHFINHSQLEFARTGNYKESIRSVFIAVGPALFMTSLVLIMNFSVYLTSVARVYINMGILTGAGISAALLADYFVTPVLLQWAKPFGKEKSLKSHIEQAADYDLAAAGRSTLDHE